MNNRRYRKSRGATLLFVLVILVLTMAFASRRVLENTTTRLAGAGDNFRTESQWIAESVASQWADLSKTPGISVDALLSRAQWTMGRYQIDIKPGSSQDKIHVGHVPAGHWLPFFRQRCDVQLTQEPEKTLNQRGSGALEMLLHDQYLSSQIAYVGDALQQVPADILTVWGSGRVDLNHCSREILAVRLHGFTDAQISGILRIRAEAPIVRLDHLGEALSLTEHQKEVLAGASALAPDTLELVIQIKKGVLSSLYHAVIGAGGNARAIEVRLVQ